MNRLRIIGIETGKDKGIICISCFLNALVNGNEAASLLLQAREVNVSPIRHCPICDSSYYRKTTVEAAVIIREAIEEMMKRMDEHFSMGDGDA